MRSVLFVLALIALGSAACATGSSGDRTGTRRDLITAEELAQHQGLSAHEAIQQLRPHWLRSMRGAGAPRVVVDRMPVERDYLHSLQVADIQEMRLLSAATATMRHGTGYPAGAIEIRTSRG